jgi:hypothetical protein
MTKKNNQNNKSGQLARSSQKKQKQNSINQNSLPRVMTNNSLGQPSLAAPVAYSSPTQNMPPRINNSRRMSRVIHRELVATISGNTTFGTQTFALNPGIAASFPWLSTIAPSYEQYCFKRLRFHYVTRCATTYVGSVLLAPEYDALDAAPTTEVDTAMMAGAKEDVPWRDQFIDFNIQDMFPLGPRKYVRTGALTATADLKTYDAGQLVVGLASCTDTSAIGKLWVDYEVELHIPQNPNSIQTVGVGATFISNISVNQSVATGVAEIIAWNELVYDTISVTNTAGSLVLPAGDYSYIVVANGSTDDAGATPIIWFELNGLINGSAASPPQYSSVRMATLDNEATSIQVILQGYVSSNGTTALSINAELTAAGTLNLDGDRSKIIITRIL